jgi:hypothetical protein
MDFPQKVFYGVFELPLLRNAQKRHKKKKVPTPFSGHLPDIRRFQFSFSSAPLARRGRKNKTGGSQTDPPADFFLGPFPVEHFFFSTFLVLSRWGEFKNTTKMFLQKAHVKNFFPKIDKNFNVSVSSNYFLFSRLFVCFSAMGVPKYYKKRFENKSCRKVFTKKSTKNRKPIFLGFFYPVFGRFSVRRVKKHHTINILKINLTLFLFLASDPPTHPRGSPVFFAGFLPRSARSLLLVL